ncbi:MAG: hypothetical protein COA58_08385 [Bacteroidetes bacterium]|nr:MAG: hypothetical protein COA58_08385 [Bacteroidota bacterium]
MKRFLKITSFILFLLILAASGTVFYFYKNIKPILVSEINKTLAVKVEVGEISISGIKDFPNLGIKFSDVSINESTVHYNKKLLQAKELNLFIDVLKLYKGEYVIDGVTLRNGTLNVVDLKNRTNYDIIKKTSDTTSSNLSFEIKNLSLIDCHIRYEHTPSKFKSKAYTPSSILKLKYIGESTDLVIQTTLNEALIQKGQEVYVANKNLKLNTHIVVNEEKVEISPSDLIIEEVSLKTRGFVGYGETPEVDITFANDNTTTQSLLSILPTSISRSLENLDLKGEVVLNGFFKGRIDKNHNPSFGFDFNLNNTSLGFSNQDIRLSGINASGSLNIPDISNLNTAKANCKLAKAKSGSNSLSGKISVLNFVKPRITWNGNASLDAPFIFAFAKVEGFKAKTGRIETTGKLSLTYNTKKESLEPNSLRYTGTIKIKNLSGDVIEPKLTLKKMNVDLSADNDRIVVNSADFHYNNTTGSIKGYIEKYQSIFNENSSATLAGELYVDNLDINELQSSSAVKEENSEVLTNNEIVPINLKLKTELTNFKYNDFNASLITGNLISNRTQIGMPKCEITALDGKTIASINVKKWGENYLLDINTDIKKVNISKLFKQFNNFEQNEITDKHISGEISGSILAKVILDQNFEPILSKLYAKANITINNGALIGYEPLKELSSFAHIDDLKNVKFNTLKNTIEIFDETIFIPKMRIENNALNLQISGTHTFDNYMKYNMSLSVAELLATKANWIAKKKEKRIENNSSGGLTAYIIMEGTPDDLTIRYDRAAVKENVKKEITAEKKKFIQALKGEGTLEEETAETKDYDNVWDE